MKIEEIYGNFKKTMDFYIAELDQLTAEQFARKPTQNAWSLGQMYEHLYTSTHHLFFKRIHWCLTADAHTTTDGELSETGRKVFAHNSFPPIKLKTPRQFETPETIAKPREYFKEKFAEILVQAADLVPALQADSGTHRSSHPVMGNMNAAEWFRLLEIHHRHHLRQKREIEEYLQWIEMKEGTNN